MSPRTPAILVLKDGTVFRGTSIGANGVSAGEVVFNTAITGYQEILTDPSYCRQIVTLTYPHIGNTGANAEDVESDRVYAAGLVIRDLPLLASSFRMKWTLDEYLKRENVVAIADIDTRKLTRILRDKGAQDGCIMAGTIDEKAALRSGAGFSRLEGHGPRQGGELQEKLRLGRNHLDAGQRLRQAHRSEIQRGGLRLRRQTQHLAHAGTRGCEVTVVPAQTPAKDVLAMKPDGVFLSNGPGDPEPCDYAIAAIRELLEASVPLFGICLGHQLMGLASGAKTMKMKFGHHGANHPVQDLDTGRVMITSQNHGFAVDAKTLPANCRVTHVSLFDGSLQGFARTDKPAFCFQGHPEASPGPHDVGYLFDRFVEMMERP